MRLLLAEVRKLRRPLTVWTAVAILVLVGLFAWGGQKNAAQQVKYSIPQVSTNPPPCEAFGLQPGPDCTLAQQRWVVEAEQSAKQAMPYILSEAKQAALVRNPLGAGAIAASMMASLLGAVALLLLAAGHVGNEWSGRTIKQVLTQEGRRWRVLAAKLGSLFVAGVALLLLLWAMLALLAPVFDAAYPLPVKVAAGTALHASWSATWRSLVVIGAFAFLGTLSAVITRNTLGSFFLGFAFVIAAMILAGFKAVARYTLAYWVAGWMRFHGQGLVPVHVWRDDFYPLKFPTAAAGLIGLVTFMALCGVIAWARIERSDVKV